MSKAKESAQIQKARKKIQRQIEAAEKRITPESLSKMTLLIHRQLSRSSPERISLTTKSITLFDENRHSAKTESRFVRKLLQHIKNLPGTGKALDGRISSVKKAKNRHGSSVTQRHTE
jgi:hypothetical protein